MKVTILGCGTSSGVPRIGNDWGLCDPSNPKNRRSRASILVEDGDVRLLVDTGPDLRQQLLDNDISWVTAILYTHDHADHTHGIDDLRALFHSSGHEIPCYMNEPTHRTLLKRFGYVFEGRGGYPATATAHLLEKQMQFGRIEVTPFPQIHGGIYSMGFRFTVGKHSIAYSTDLNDIPEESWPMLDNLDLWVVDALKRDPHPTHSYLAKTEEWVMRAAPKEALLTHMDQSMDYETLLKELKNNIKPSFDGLIREYKD